MTTATVPKIDPADVATVEALKPQVEALISAVESALPACNRLIAAGYAGTQWLAEAQLESSVDEDRCVAGDLVSLRRALHLFHISKGRREAFEYHRACDGEGGISLDQAVDELLADDEDFELVQAMRTYAASIGKGER